MYHPTVRPTLVIGEKFIENSQGTFWICVYLHFNSLLSLGPTMHALCTHWRMWVEAHGLIDAAGQILQLASLLKCWVVPIAEHSVHFFLRRLELVSVLTTQDSSISTFQGIFNTETERRLHERLWHIKDSTSAQSCTHCSMEHKSDKCHGSSNSCERSLH